MARLIRCEPRPVSTRNTPALFECDEMESLAENSSQPRTDIAVMPAGKGS